MKRFHLILGLFLFCSVPSFAQLNCSGGTCPLNSPVINGTIGGYNGLTPVSGAVAVIVATTDRTVQAASISFTTIYAVPSTGAGFYRFTCYVIVTQAATSSSTMPHCGVQYTTAETTNVTNADVSTSSSANVVGANSATQSNNVYNSVTFNAKASTNIQYDTTNYASSGVTPMQYTVHVRLEYLGP